MSAAQYVTIKGRVNTDARAHPHTHTQRITAVTGNMHEIAYEFPF